MEHFDAGLLNLLLDRKPFAELILQSSFGIDNKLCDPTQGLGS
jgi:hypothetical protein